MEFLYANLKRPTTTVEQRLADGLSEQKQRRRNRHQWYRMAYDFRQQPAAIERNVMIWNHIRNLQPFKMSHKYRLFFHLVHYLNGQPCTAEASCYDHDLYTSLLQKAPATVTENVLLDHIVWLIQQMASVADFLTEVYDRKPQQRTEMTKGMSTPDHLAASMLTLLLTTYSRCKLTPKDTARLATIAIHLVSAFGEVESLFDRTLYALRAILRCLKTDERRHLAEHHTFAVDIMRFIDHPSSPMRENVLGFCRQLVQYSQEIAIVLMDRGLLGRMRELLVHPFIEQRSSRNEITEIMRIIDDVTATHRSDIWRVIAADVVPALYGVIDAIATDRHQLIFDFMRIVNNVAQIGALDQFAVMLPENGALRLVEAHLACGSVSCILQTLQIYQYLTHQSCQPGAIAIATTRILEQLLVLRQHRDQNVSMLASRLLNSRSIRADEME